MDPHQLLIKTIDDTINIASQLSENENDCYAKVVEELLKAKYQLNKVNTNQVI